MVSHPAITSSLLNTDSSPHRTLASPKAYRTYTGIIALISLNT